MDVDNVLEEYDSQKKQLEDYLKLSLMFYRNGDRNKFRHVAEHALYSLGTRLDYENVDNDRIKLMLSLSAYYINEGIHENDKSKSIRHFDEAMVNINGAERIDSNCYLVWLHRGYLLLSKNLSTTQNKDYQSSQQQFQMVLERNPHCVPAMICMAWIHYELDNYKESYMFYKKILELWQTDITGLYMSIGLCLFKLGNMEDSEHYFKKILEDADGDKDKSLASLISLSIIGYNKMTKEGTTDSISYIERAYKIDSSNSTVLNKVSNHFFFQNDLEKSKYFAKLAYTNGDSDYIKAESCFILGKVCHVRKQYEEAGRFYAKSIKLCEEFTPSSFCLAQVYIYMEEYEKSAELLEGILERDKNNHEALKILSILNSRVLKNIEKAIEYSQRSTKLRPDDIESLIEYASLIEQTDYKGAIEIYESVLSVIENNNSIIKVPPEIVCNIGSLLFMNEHYQGSFIRFNQARSICENILQEENLSIERTKYYNKLVTIIDFNIGRSYEEMSQMHIAESLYKQILGRDKENINCYLRLGIIKMKQNDFSAASDFYKDALGIDENCIKAWNLLAIQHISIKSYLLAVKTLKRILNQIDKYDPYTMLLLGNLYITMSKLEKKHSRNWDYYLKSSFSLFYKLLTINEDNFYAFNGLVIVSSLYGLYSIAKDGFSRLKNQESWFMDSWINLANIYVEEGHFSAAINIYENCFKRLDRGNLDVLVQLMIYISKSYYLLGKSTKDSAFFLKSLDILQKLYLYIPSNYSMSFNIALCQQEYSISVLGKDVKSRSFKEISFSSKILDISFFIFNFLDEYASKQGTRSNLSYDPRISLHRAKYCSYIKKNMNTQYQKQIEEEKQHQGRVEKLKLNRELLKTEKKRRLEETNPRAEDNPKELDDTKKRTKVVMSDDSDLSQE